MQVWISATSVRYGAGTLSLDRLTKVDDLEMDCQDGNTRCTIEKVFSR